MSGEGRSRIYALTVMGTLELFVLLAAWLHWPVGEGATTFLALIALPGYVLLFPFFGLHGDPPFWALCLISWVVYTLLVWACLRGVFSLIRIVRKHRHG